MKTYKFLVRFHWFFSNDLSIPKRQRLHRWRLGRDKLFHPTLYWACNYLSMLGLKLIHVNKRGHRLQWATTGRYHLAAVWHMDRCCWHTLQCYYTDQVFFLSIPFIRHKKSHYKDKTVVYNENCYNGKSWFFCMYVNLTITRLIFFISLFLFWNL